MPRAEQPSLDDEDVDPEDAFAAAVAAARIGDPQACAEIWRRFAPGVAAYARARGSRDPDDLTSEVFLAVFRQLSAFQGGVHAFRGFVFTIAHRRLVDELRARSRRPQTVTWSEDDDRRHVASAEEQAVAALGDRDARRMLEALVPDQRDVLVLRIFGDLTVEQVAEVLGKSTGAVKALQRRGLAALRRNLATTRTPSEPRDDGTR